MKEYIASGVITAGKLRVKQQADFEAAMRQFRDGDVSVTVERKHATRSEQQNRWYWSGILAALSEHTGYTVDEMHEYCKDRFNAKTISIVDGHGEVKDEQRIGQSTTKLNRLTFGEYCENIRMWAASELGIDIPDPDPDWKASVTRRTEAAA